jgi:hypothetical protein
MYTFLTASKDATIYFQQPTQNTGLDEILEISKTYYGNSKDVAHTLIKFETTALSASLASGAVTMSSAELILKECEANEIPIDYTIYAYPISESWDMGVGTRFDDISTDGVTWNYRASSNGDWLSTTGANEISSSLYRTTLSGATGTFNGKGGVFYTSSAASQSFNYQSTDIQMNIKPMLEKWITGSIVNQGIILKYSGSTDNSSSIEGNTEDYGQLKFFAKETNTIYQPKIRIGWNDQSFVTGSLTQLTSDDIHVTFKKLKTKYKVGSTPEIGVFAREKYPLKTYSNTFAYNDIKYLPSTTYYQIKDMITDEIIIQFSDYTKVSCNSNGNYFKLNLTNWETNRSYYVEIKIDRSGVIEYFSDKDLTFTIEK